MKKSIWYAGTELEFHVELDDPRVAELYLIAARKSRPSRKAACTHEYGKTQVYIEPKKEEVRRDEKERQTTNKRVS